MADKSNIAWTDSTFNPWIGCTRVSEGCVHCYAENLMDVRYKIEVNKLVYQGREVEAQRLIYEYLGVHTFSGQMDILNETLFELWEIIKLSVTAISLSILDWINTRLERRKNVR